MPLSVDVGYSSLTGPRPRNEDFCGVVTPAAAELEAKGVLAAVADGVGGHAGGREAAEATVRGLLADYYATPDTWSVPRALDAVLHPLNAWLISQGTARRELAGMATTLSALVLRGRRYTTAHVGDSRIYLLRDGEFTRLTTDHVWDHPELHQVLRRAVGLDATLTVDYDEGELEERDIFLLICDGVWSTLREDKLAALLQQDGPVQAAAEAIAAGALAAGGNDNATAVVLRVTGLPAPGRRDAEDAARRLPLPPRLKAGDLLDGYTVEAVLHDSRETLLYRVRDADGSRCVLKTLVPGLDDDEAARALLAREAWLLGRAASRHLPQAVPITNGRASAFYILMSWHDGDTLQHLLDAGRHFTVSDAAHLGMRLLKGLGALHRLDILHRDVKPANLHLGTDGTLRLLDLGVAASAADEEAAAGNPGTPSFMAPELLAGEPCSVPSDLYAAGVTLYHLLTRKYPYGEIEPFQHPKFGDPVPPTRYRPEIPAWLEDVLLKAVAREKKHRFETAEEFLLALERGDRSRLRVQRRTPLMERDPARFWRGVALGMLVLNLVLVFLLVTR